MKKEYQEYAAEQCESGNSCPAQDLVPHVCHTKKDFDKQSKAFHPDKNIGCPDESKDKWEQFQSFASCGNRSVLPRE